MDQDDLAENKPMFKKSEHSSAKKRLTVSIFADRTTVRNQMRDDAKMAGFAILEKVKLNGLVIDEMKPLGDVVLLDNPEFDEADLAVLSLLDARASKSGAHIIVSTALESLELIVYCLDQSMHQVLVDPSRSDRAIALNHALLFLPNSRVCDLSEKDRLAMLRLTEQMSEIGQKFDRLGAPAAIGPEPDSSAFRFETPHPADAGAYAGAEESDGSARLVRAARPALPDPRLVRRIIRQRQLRARFFDGDLFADPAWDMLLDLTAARAEHARVSVTSLCIASSVPPTTALRWIGQMSEEGLLERVEDEIDRRRAFITLTDKAVDAMARYFADIGMNAGRLV